MRKIKYLLLLCILLMGGIFGLYIYPYVKYVSVVSGKATPSWFKLASPVHRGHHNLADDSIDHNQKEYETLWQKFPVSHYKIPLPVHHPEYIVIPIVDYTGSKQRPRFGFNYSNNSGSGIVKSYFLAPTSFRRSFNSQWLFRIPLIKEFLKKRSHAQIWRDIFERDLKVWKVSMYELAYSAYILYQRSRLFPNSISSYTYDNNKRIAVLSIDTGNPDFSAEIIKYLSDDNTIYSFILKTRKIDEKAKDLRLRIINEMEYFYPSEDISERLYTDFKSLNYAEQIDQEGMFYLFTAWTYKYHSKEFLKEAIQFLERGKDNLPLLDPLYAHAYKEFGTTFSLIDDKRRETEKEKLKRRVDEEALAERRKEEATDLTDIEVDQLSEEQRLEYMLRNAKENESREDDILRMD